MDLEPDSELESARESGRAYNRQVATRRSRTCRHRSRQRDQVSCSQSARGREPALAPEQVLAQALELARHRQAATHRPRTCRHRSKRRDRASCNLWWAPVLPVVSALEPVRELVPAHRRESIHR